MKTAGPELAPRLEWDVGPVQGMGAIMLVRDVCTRAVAIASPNESVRDAARRMSQLSLDTLVVLHPVHEERAIGILTAGDVTKRCVAPGLDPDLTPVSAAMSAPAHSIGIREPIAVALRVMACECVRRLVVTDDHGWVMGLLTIEEILADFDRPTTDRFAPCGAATPAASRAAGPRVPKAGRRLSPGGRSGHPRERRRGGDVRR